MKSRRDGGQSETGKRARSTPFTKRQQKRTVSLGGGGLNLEAFAAAKKSKPFVSPAQIREHRGAYKNAKKVQKYKKLVGQLRGHDRSLKDEEAAEILDKVQGKQIANDKSHAEKKSEVGFASRRIPLPNTHGKPCKPRRKQFQQLKGTSQMEKIRDKSQKEEFDKKVRDTEELQDEQQQAREKVEHAAKATQGMLRKRTRWGQPVMKHQMERLLEAIQRSS